MFLTVDENVTLHVKTAYGSSSGRVPILFLHGFTGSVLDWDYLFRNLPEEIFPAAVDLPGHGLSSSPLNVSSDSAQSLAQQIGFVIDKLGIAPPVLCGYSMGGRAALYFAANYPGLLSGLILESTTAGITEQKEREGRLADDEKLAFGIESEGIESFTDFWMNLPMFDSQKLLAQDKYDLIRQRKLSGNPAGFKNSLLGFGTGAMPSLWDKLNSIEQKVLLITGGLDKKFTDINSRMKLFFKNAEHMIVENAGHNVHLEREDAYLKLVTEYLKELK